MRRFPSFSPRLTGVAALGCAAALTVVAGCSAPHPAAQDTGKVSTLSRPATTRPAAPAVPSKAGPPPAASAPVAAAAASSGSAPATSGVPACATSGLMVWLNVPPGNDYAGGADYSLEFTNQSGHTCTLRGAPGVSAVTLAGSQLGSPAGWVGTASTVTLANGATASSTLQIADTSVFGTSCYLQPPTQGHPGILPTAAGLRVYPPNQTAATMVPYPLWACAHAGPVYIHASPVTLTHAYPGL
jgi:hypothetical protein